MHRELTKRRTVRSFAAIACAGCALALAFALSLPAGCRAPTEITLEARPFDLCAGGGADLRIAMTGGRPGTTNTAAPNAKVTGCPPSGAYTLVYVPAGDQSENVELLVVAAIGKDPAMCDMSTKDPACIWERRAVSFIPHTPLDVVVDLARSCLGVPCNEDTTCDPRNGQCISKAKQIVTCAELSCAEAGMPGDGAMDVGEDVASGDAAPDAVDEGTDATSAGDGPVDGAGDAPADAGSKDATSDTGGSDAAGDAADTGASDGAFDGNTGTFVFGNGPFTDGGIRCRGNPDCNAASEKCQFDPSSLAPGTCIAKATTCASGHLCMGCDGIEDCPSMQFCCLVVGGSACVDFGTGATACKTTPSLCSGMGVWMGQLACGHAPNDSPGCGDDPNISPDRADYGTCNQN
jgi:hypothetical protein